MKTINPSDAIPGKCVVKITEHPDNVGEDVDVWDDEGRMLKLLDNGNMGIFACYNEGSDTQVQGFWVDEGGDVNRWNVQETCCEIYAIDDALMGDTKRSNITIGTAKKVLYLLTEIDDPKAKEAMDILLGETE